MQTQESKIQDRNREIGRLLKEARMYRNVTVTTCAELIGTSRRRYVAMERGDAIIGVAELEVLIEFLGEASHKILHLNKNEGSKDQIVVPFTPGKPVQIVFDARR